MSKPAEWHKWYDFIWHKKLVNGTQRSSDPQHEKTGLQYYKKLRIFRDRRWNFSCLSGSSVCRSYDRGHLFDLKGQPMLHSKCLRNTYKQTRQEDFSSRRSVILQYPLCSNLRLFRLKETRSVQREECFPACKPVRSDHTAFSHPCVVYIHFVDISNTVQ
jgi:hypothetical protein